MTAKAVEPFRHPEGTLYHRATERFLISNDEGGEIIQIDNRWDTTFFSTELDYAAGMVILGDTLFVAYGPYGIAALDINSGAHVYTIPIAGALRVNDVCADSSGYLWVTDPQLGWVFKLNIAARTSQIVTTALPWVNGVHYDYRNDRILVNQWIINSPISAIDPQTHAVSVVTSTTLDHLNGFTDDAEGNFYITAWGDPYNAGNGGIYRFDSLFADPPVLLSNGYDEPGDMYYDKQTTLIVVTNFGSYTVEFLYDPLKDPDDDGILSATDNCPLSPNSGQSDGDTDGVGDACDNCPDVYNPLQIDRNLSGIGDICEPGFTAAGYWVQVDLTDSVSVLFSEVVEVGVTSLLQSAIGPVPPSGYHTVPEFGTRYFDIHTDATHSGAIRVRLLYDPADISGDESNLRVFHESGAKSGSMIWEDCTYSQDPGSHLIWGEVSNLSTFILAEPDCMCECHNDPQCDGETGVLDVVQAVNVAFRNYPDITDPQTGCPHTSTDCDCDFDTDVIDVVKFVNVAFRNFDAATEFCDPCPPETFLGQESPGPAPEPFLPGFFDGDTEPHSQLTVNPDATEVYWYAVDPDIWQGCVHYSIFDGDSLTAPVAAPFIESDWYYRGMAFGADGNRIYFGSVRPLPEPDGDTMLGIWYIEYTDPGWGDPAAVPATLDQNRWATQVSVGRSGSLYFMGWPLDDPASYRVYCSEFVGGSHQTPEPIAALDGYLDPFVDPNEQFILVAHESGEHGGGDIYVSFRQPDDSWGLPINLGTIVNGSGHERFPSVSPDGRYLFFARAIPFLYEAEYYWIDADFLGELQP
jgi:hypothetical protein